MSEPDDPLPTPPASSSPPRSRSVWSRLRDAFRSAGLAGERAANLRFEEETSPPSADLRLFQVSGPIDDDTAPVLNAWCQGVLEDAGSCRVVWNAAQVTYLNGAGIGAAVACAERLRARGGGLALVGAAAKVEVVVELLDLGDFLWLCADAEEAADRLRAGHPDHPRIPDVHRPFLPDDAPLRVWEFFVVDEPIPASVLLCTAYAEQAPLKSCPWRLELTVPFSRPHEALLAPPDEAARLESLEGSLLPALRRAGAKVVAREIERDRQRWVFFAPGAELHQEPRVRRACAQAGSPAGTWALAEDPEWSWFARRLSQL